MSLFQSQDHQSQFDRLWSEIVTNVLSLCSSLCQSWGGSMIDMERINSQEMIIYYQSGGWGRINNQHGQDQQSRGDHLLFILGGGWWLTWNRSTVKRWSPIINPRGGWGIDDWHGEDQQSTLCWSSSCWSSISPSPRTDKRQLTLGYPNPLSPCEARGCN